GADAQAEVVLRADGPACTDVSAEPGADRAAWGGAGGRRAIRRVGPVGCAVAPVPAPGAGRAAGRFLRRILARSKSSDGLRRAAGCGGDPRPGWRRRGDRVRVLSAGLPVAVAVEPEPESEGNGGDRSACGHDRGRDRLERYRDLGR